MRALAALGARAHLIETERAADLADALADLSAFDAVCAAGGDGTLRALAGALEAAGSRLPLALIPTGTGNVMACELALPRDAPGIARMLVHGPARDIAGGRANGELFLCMCGAGFDGEVVARLAPSLKRRIGRAAYTGPVLAPLARKPSSFDVTIDGTPRRATWVVASNVRRYGGSFVIAPEADVTQPGLHAVVMTARTRTGRATELLAIAARRPHRCPTIEIVPCRSLVISAALPIEIDGDVLGTGPLRVETVERAATLVFPPRGR